MDNVGRCSTTIPYLERCCQEMVIEFYMMDWLASAHCCKMVWLSTALASLSESGTCFLICLVLSSTISAGFRLCSCSLSLTSKSTHWCPSGCRCWFLLDQVLDQGHLQCLICLEIEILPTRLHVRCRLLSWGRAFEFEVIVVGCCRPWFRWFYLGRLSPGNLHTRMSWRVSWVPSEKTQKVLLVLVPSDGI